MWRDENYLKILYRFSLPIQWLAWLFAFVMEMIWNSITTAVCLTQKAVVISYRSSLVGVLLESVLSSIPKDTSERIAVPNIQIKAFQQKQDIMETPFFVQGVFNHDILI